MPLATGSKMYAITRAYGNASANSGNKLYIQLITNKKLTCLSHS